jgi:mRNA interferase RelE/StbE
MTPRYELLIEPAAYRQRTRLPGHVRQRIRRAIDGLAQHPRPHDSRALDTTGLDVPAGVEIRRIRMGQWRLIYAVSDVEKWVWVWGVRKRPPYDYDDLAEMIRSL